MMLRAVLVGAFMLSPMMYFEYMKYSMQNAAREVEWSAQASGSVDISGIGADLLKQGVMQCVEMLHGDLIPKRQRRMFADYLIELKYRGNRSRALSEFRAFLRETRGHRALLRQRDEAMEKRYSTAIFYVQRQRNTYYDCGVDYARKMLKSRKS